MPAQQLSQEPKVNRPVGMDALTPKQQRFVEEYLIDLNATAAAKRAGYSEKTANEQGARLLAHVGVAEEIASRRKVVSARAEITAEKVLKELWAIATADPGELIQFRRGACRKCWSDASAIEETLEPQGHGGALKRTRNAAVFIAEVDKDPNPDCEECRGEGAGRAYIADTRTLSDAGKKLYAGVKITKEGVEVKMHDKVTALVTVGKHLGMFADRVEHSGSVAVEHRHVVDPRQLPDNARELVRQAALAISAPVIEGEAWEVEE